MKGMLFRAYMDYADTILSADQADSMLADEALSSGGAFTNIGNYPHSDLALMNHYVAKETGVTAGEALCNFGIFLFPALAGSHSEITSKLSSLEHLLLNIEAIIHRDVRKIYPDARPPMFNVLEHRAGHSLKLEYRSDRAMAELARGILIGALRHFGLSEKDRLHWEDRSDVDGSAVFDIRFGRDEQTGASLEHGGAEGS